MLSISNGDTDAQVIAYDETYNVENPAISGVEGGGTAVCATYGPAAYPTVILIAPNHDILKQDIWPIPSMQTIIDIVEPYGPVATDCEHTPSTETEVLTFSIPDQLNATIVDGAIDIIVPVGTDLTAIVPEFTISEGATAYIDDVEQISGSSTVDFSSGSINYEIIAEDETTTQTWTITIEDNEGIAAIGNIKNTAYPNPASDYIHLNNKKNARIEILNILGERVLEITDAPTNMKLDLSEFINGTYIVKQILDGKATIEKIMIQK